MEPRVNVIGIGVQKAATSWLFRCLIEHPEVRGAAVHQRDKELNFFNHHYEYGYDWYEGHFEHGEWKNVEFSVLYFHDQNVATRIREYNREARLLLCLRNPVERAISQYRHEISNRRLDAETTDFWAAMRRNPSFVEQGLYGKHLRRWFQHFDREQVHIVDYDEISRAPKDVLCGAFEFVGVDAKFDPSIAGQRVNTSRILGEGPLRRAFSLGIGTVRSVVGTKITQRLARSTLGRRIQDYRYVEVGHRESATVGAAERTRLAKKFEHDIALLEELLGRDYSHWK